MQVRPVRQIFEQRLLLKHGLLREVEVELAARRKVRRERRRHALDLVGVGGCEDLAFAVDELPVTFGRRVRGERGPALLDRRQFRHHARDLVERRAEARHFADFCPCRPRGAGFAADPGEGRNPPGVGPAGLEQHQREEAQENGRRNPRPP